MTIAVIVCLLGLVVLLFLLRRTQPSLGLPLAYMGGLLVIHVPGAIAHIVAGSRLFGAEWVEIGIDYTAIAVVCFVAGVWLARRFTKLPKTVMRANRAQFAIFCLLGGWALVYGLSPIAKIPSIGAAVDKAGGIWILGVLLGLRASFKAGNPVRIAGWLAALSVYPVIMLVLGGFASYGEAATVVVISVLAVVARSYWKALAGIAVASVVGLTLFVNYFEHRTDLRNDVAMSHSVADRMSTFEEMVATFHLVDFDSEKDLVALDQRLNQNLFVGLSADRIGKGEVDYLKGQTLWDGVLALVPRAYWADKPVSAGSGTLVSDMTGLELNQDTSWGVGNVMEFYINFGVPGIIVGFLALGWLIATLDLRAADAERRGDMKLLIILFLPAIAVINPGGSIVEITGGAVSALVAAFGWRWAWGVRERQLRARARTSVLRGLPQPGADVAS